MKIIKRKAHAVLDYLWGVAMIASPWVLSFSQSATASNVAVIAGATVVLVSFFTQYEGGIYRKIPMSLHLDSDLFVGLLLAGSPWIFGFYKAVYIPHLVMGLIAFVVAILSERSSYVEPT